MALYLISYDIADKDAFEYEPLWEKLREMGARKILYSEWVVADPAGRANAIYGEISPLTTVQDRLLVQEVTSDAVWDKLLLTDDAFRGLLQSARG